MKYEVFSSASNFVLFNLSLLLSFNKTMKSMNHKVWNFFNLEFFISLLSILSKFKEPTRERCLNHTTEDELNHNLSLHSIDKSICIKLRYLGFFHFFVGNIAAMA